MAPLSDESRCHNSKKCRNDDVDACCVGDDVNDDDNDDDDDADDNDDDDAGDDNVANKFETITSERWLPRKGLSDDRHIKLPFSLSLSLSLSLSFSVCPTGAHTNTLILLLSVSLTFTYSHYPVFLFYPYFLSLFTPSLSFFTPVSS